MRKLMTEIKPGTVYDDAGAVAKKFVKLGILELAEGEFWEQYGGSCLRDGSTVADNN